MSLEKSQVLSKQNELLDENKKLVAQIKDSKFLVECRLEHFGFISQLDTIGECVEALTFLNTKSASSTEAMKELELDGENESTFLGYEISDWKTDIKTRKLQIESSFKIEANLKAIALLEKHMSLDDIFNRDMEKIDSLLTGKKTSLTKSVDQSIFNEIDDDDENE
jgi:hypothetical protein